MKINKLSRAVLISTALLFTSSLVFAQESETLEQTDSSETVTEETASEDSVSTESVSTTDTYEETAETEPSDSPDEYTEASPEADKTAAPDEYVETELPKKDKKKNAHNPFEGMFTQKQTNYLFYDQIKLSTGTIGYGIKPRTAEVFVDPKTKKAGIQVYYQSSFFDFMFDEKNIALIQEGYEKYLEDFAAHTLIKKNTMKTRKMYTAKGKCRTEWGSVKIMMNYYGNSQFHVGYEFKKNSPYFCIIVKGCKNIATDIGVNVPEESVEVQLYFTKAEARQFLDSLSRETVLQKLSETDEYLELQSDSDY